MSSFNLSQRLITDINTFGNAENITTYEAGWSQHASTAPQQGRLTGGNLPFSYNEPILVHDPVIIENVSRSGAHRVHPVNIQERINASGEPIMTSNKEGFVGIHQPPPPKTMGLIDETIERFTSEYESEIFIILIIIIVACVVGVCFGLLHPSFRVENTSKITKGGYFF